MRFKRTSLKRRFFSHLMITRIHRPRSLARCNAKKSPELFSSDYASPPSPRTRPGSSNINASHSGELEPVG